MAKGSLEKEFGPITGMGAGKETGSGEEGAAADILSAIKSNDPGSLRAALKLFMEECGVYTNDGESADKNEADEGEG